MGVSALEVSSFETSPGSIHTIAADSGLSLMTVKIEHLTSASELVLNRPDGKNVNFKCLFKLQESAKTKTCSGIFIIYICIENYIY